MSCCATCHCGLTAAGHLTHLPTTCCATRPNHSNLFLNSRRTILVNNNSNNQFLQPAPSTIQAFFDRPIKAVAAGGVLGIYRRHLGGVLYGKVSGPFTGLGKHLQRPLRGPATGRGLEMPKLRVVFRVPTFWGPVLVSWRTGSAS